MSDINKFDSQKMHKVYDMWPKIAKESYFSDLDLVEYEKSDHIIFAGMGGSGAIGDIFSAILSKTSTHVTVAKGYHLPKTVTEDSVVVISSISGNTIETISMLENAIKLNSKIIVFSDGGKIEKICKEKNIPLYRVESRMSLGEWSGLCRYDANNDAKKVRPCSCVVVKLLPQSDATKVVL